MQITTQNWVFLPDFVIFRSLWKQQLRKLMSISGIKPSSEEVLCTIHAAIDSSLRFDKYVEWTCLFTTGTTGTIIRSACLNKYTTPSISRVKPSSTGVNPSNFSLIMLCSKVLRLSVLLRTIYWCHSSWNIHWTMPSSYKHPLINSNFSLCHISWLVVSSLKFPPR